MAKTLYAEVFTNDGVYMSTSDKLTDTATGLFIADEIGSGEGRFFPWHRVHNVRFFNNE